MKIKPVKPEAIKVNTGLNGEPLSLTRNAHKHMVSAVYERWRLADEWWGKEVKRHYFKIATSRGVFDIYHDVLADRWYLERVED